MKQQDIPSIPRELQLTADGSHTLFVPSMNEHYHSVNGAIQESLHIFIRAGLHRVAKETVRILEIGFGTGLNAFLTLLQTTGTGPKVEYYTVELYPLQKELVRTLNYPAVTCPEKEALFEALHEAPWDCPVCITPAFRLHKIYGDSNTCLLPDAIDLIYFDAFAPDKQPEMWTPQLFARLYAHTATGGILTTYCAKGAVRRMMQAVGYDVERIPGPPGKREMLRATKKA